MLFGYLILVLPGVSLLGDGAGLRTDPREVFLLVDVVDSEPSDKDTYNGVRPNQPVHMSYKAIEEYHDMPDLVTLTDGVRPKQPVHLSYNVSFLRLVIVFYFCCHHHLNRSMARCLCP